MTAATAPLRGRRSECRLRLRRGARVARTTVRPAPLRRHCSGSAGSSAGARGFDGLRQRGSRRSVRRERISFGAQGRAMAEGSDPGARESSRGAACPATTSCLSDSARSIWMPRRSPNALARHRAELCQALDRIQGASEWGVKLYCDQHVLRRRIEAESASIRGLRDTLAQASPGARFFLQKKYAKALDDEAAATIASCVERIGRSLDDLACRIYGGRAAAGLRCMAGPRTW